MTSRTSPLTVAWIRQSKLRGRLASAFRVGITTLIMEQCEGALSQLQNGRCRMPRFGLGGSPSVQTSRFASGGPGFKYRG